MNKYLKYKKKYLKLIAGSSTVEMPSDPNQFIENAIQIMKKICKKYNDSMKVCLELQNGFFYQNEYYKKLKNCIEKNPANQSFVERLNYFKKNNSFYHGFAPLTDWSIIDDPQLPTGKLICNYQKKPSKNASEVLDKLFTDARAFIFIDCFTAIQLSLLKALKEMTPLEKFNKHFTELIIGPRNAGFVLKIFNPVESQSFVRGNIYFVSNQNTMEYSEKHDHGEGGGWWVLCIASSPDERFLGFGLNEEGINLYELKEILVNAYNEDPISYDMFSDDLKKILQDKPIYKVNVENKDRKITIEGFKTSVISLEFKRKEFQTLFD